MCHNRGQLALALAALAMLGLVTPGPSSAQPVRSPAPAPTTQVTLRDVLWQPLPADVKIVTVGPDGRVWYTIGSNQASDVPAMKGAIQPRFHDASPVLIGIRPVYFEKSGRVWFAHGYTLLAYNPADGSWIEHAMDKTLTGVVGNAPGNGAINLAGCNREVAGRLVFLTNHGVEMYDPATDEWGSAPVEPKTDVAKLDIQSSGTSWLLVEPDGKGMIVTAHGREAKSVRRWRDGQWSDLSTGGFVSLDSRADTVSGAAIAGDGRLFLLSENDQLRILDLGSGKRQPATRPEHVAQLIKDLGADDFETRESATRTLAALGAAIHAQLQEALRNASDPEVVSRLKSLIEGPKVQQAGDGQPVQIGEVSARAFCGLCDDGHGTVFLGAREVTEHASGHETGPGLIVINPEGKPRVLWGDQFATLALTSAEWLTPLAVEPGKRVWFPSANVDLPATLLDLEKSTISPVPDSHFSFIHAVAPDGTVFASDAEPHQTSRIFTVVYRPGKRDDRPILKARSVELNPQVDERYGVCVASDGAVWTFLKDKGLQRFDGTKWEEKYNQPGMDSARVFAGNDGSVLVTSGTSAALLAGKDGFAGGTVERLLVERGDTMAKYFGGKGAAPVCGPDFSFAIDGEKRIWYCAEGRVRVRETAKANEGDWRELTDQIKEAFPGREPVGAVFAVGNGSMVYLTNFDVNPMQGAAYFAALDGGGKLRLSIAPSTEHAMAHPGLYHDADGGLWLANPRNRASAPNSWSTYGRTAKRVTDKGIVLDLPGGFARLIDASGNVWCTDDYATAAGLEYHLFHDGKEAGSLRMTDAGPRSPMLSDAPGSVYIWGVFGLTHFTSPALTDPHAAYPAAFTERERFAVVTDEPSPRAVHGGRLFILHSPLAGLVAVDNTYSNVGSDRHTWLHTVPLPGK